MNVSIVLLIITCVVSSFGRELTAQDEEDDAVAYLSSYDAMALDEFNTFVQSTWNYYSEITAENEAKMVSGIFI